METLTNNATPPELPPVPTAHRAEKYAAWQQLAAAREEEQRGKRRRNTLLFGGIAAFVLTFGGLIYWGATTDFNPQPPSRATLERALIVQGKQAVRLRLSFPETARFEKDTFNLGDRHGSIVGGEVVATNAFNVPIRYQWLYTEQGAVYLNKK